MAQELRRAYLDGKISAADFIAKIDTYHEYHDFAHKKEVPPTGDSIFRKKVKRDLDFDPSRQYFDRIRLDLGEANPQWKMITAEEWMNRDKGNDKPLAKQIEDLQPKKSEE